MRITASYTGLVPASSRASETARAASRKSNTSCELLLRRELWRLGLRYRLNVRDLPGRPDIVFRKARVAVFCDGDFWHGRDWEARSARLQQGHNASYWQAKIQGNIERDRRNTAALTTEGWTVLRFWEGDIHKDAKSVADQIRAVVATKCST